MGILGTLLGKREPVIEYRTVDGGHPAPYPDMTDEQLYNYEVTFNVPRRTFDKPPRSARPANGNTTTKKAPLRKEPPVTQEPMRESQAAQAPHTTRANGEAPQEKTFDAPRYTTTRSAQKEQPPANTQAELPPLDFSKPVRLITSKQSVEIITTRARHPIYKVHGYIGDDEVVTVFTLDGQLSENGPRFLENVPQRQQLWVNIYRNQDVRSSDRYVITQHETREQADAAAKTGRLACMPLQFDL